jgi:hypothetical protein
MSGSDDNTPVDGLSPLEQILISVQRTEVHARDTELFAECSHNLSLAWFEQHKLVAARVDRIERRRWAPAIVAVCAALFCLGCVFAIVQP